MAENYSRVIVTHTVEHVRAALEAAAGAGKPAILQSAPDALVYAGALYLLHMHQQAQREFPNVESVFIVDCGDAAAETLAAMQAGHRYVRCTCAPEYKEKLRDIAGQYGAIFIEGPFEALDLHQQSNPLSACKTWFAA